MTPSRAKTGRIYLLPSPLAPDTHHAVISPQLISVVHSLNYFLVEELRTARRYVRALEHPCRIEDLRFEQVDNKTPSFKIKNYLSPVLAGVDVGILSEAGCPGIADPGANVVRYAHQYRLEVIPLVGPSSILLALMASGLNGQAFSFHGYLPIRESERRVAILKLDKIVKDSAQTQIFIETPYRNNGLFATLLATCQSNTLLCVACDLTASEGWIQTRSIQAWHKCPVDLHKKPTVFLLGNEVFPF